MNELSLARVWHQHVPESVGSAGIDIKLFMGILQQSSPDILAVEILELLMASGCCKVQCDDFFAWLTLGISCGQSIRHPSNSRQSPEDDAGNVLQKIADASGTSEICGIQLERQSSISGLQRSPTGLSNAGHEVPGPDNDGFAGKQFPDGSKYEGQWMDEKKHGKGRFTYPDGDVYDGEWEHGKAHGNGTYTSAQSTYIGQWQNDLKHGQAEETWEDTSKYTGEFQNGQKHGRGRFAWPDGSYYEGEFQRNNVEGHGAFYWIDGRVYRGSWTDNKMNGEGRYEWPDGRAYEGQYVDDLKHGEGSFFWADGRKFTGQWSEGRQHGVGVFRTAHGDARTGEWREGVRVCWVDESAPAPAMLLTIHAKPAEKENKEEDITVLTFTNMAGDSACCLRSNVNELDIFGLRCSVKTEIGLEVLPKLFLPDGRHLDEATDKIKIVFFMRDLSLI